VSGFLVQDCVPVVATGVADVADADSKQEAQATTRLSLGELRTAVVSGRFVEVQWTAAVSLALLHLQE
jgi:hypothetical protein